MNRFRRGTLFYRFIRPFARIGLGLYFKRIILSNEESLPKEGPVLFAANHPTAFLEPCILACFQPRPLHYLVRGDFFKKPFYAFLLKSLHMLPIYRHRDGGYKSLKNNYSTFELCFDALNQGKALMILAEGRCIHEKRLRPIQKGAARIVLGALEKYPNLSIPVIPIGVNYTYAERARETVMIDFGEPIMANDYRALYQESSQKAINQFTADLEEAIAKRVVIIEDGADDVLVEQLLQLDRAKRNEKGLEGSTYLKAEKQIADFVNCLSIDQKATLKQESQAYFGHLEKYQVRDAEVAKAKRITHLGALLLGFSPFVIGYILNFPYHGIAERIAKVVRRIEFFSPIRWATNNMLGLIYYLGFFTFAIVLNQWWLWGLLALALVTGWWAIHYIDYYRRWKFEQKWVKLGDKQKKDLSKQREELLRKLESMKIEEPKNS